MNWTYRDLCFLLDQAELSGFSGDCGAAAKAINDVFFDSKGKIAYGINPHLAHGSVPFIGHVACEAPDGILWDATGHLLESDLEAWGMLDPIEYQRYGLSEEQCYDAEVVVLSLDERDWTTYLRPREPAEKKAEHLKTTINELYNSP